MPTFDMLAFDGDDTLWHNERLYAQAQARFAELLARYHDPEWVHERLYQTETRNLEHFGYGIKAFALSMIETAVELTEGRISGGDIQTLVNLARGMMTAEVELLAYVAETIPQLASAYNLMLITKGDLLDQERKIERSGLGSYFQSIEIVSHKNQASYARVLERYRLLPQRFLMVGNSLRSDVLPVLDLGGSAVYVPYEITWQHEVVDPPPDERAGYYALENLGQLLALIQKLAQES
jgi:putative hydrolase of the HAD superfamily